MPVLKKWDAIIILETDCKPYSCCNIVNPTPYYSWLQDHKNKSPFHILNLQHSYVLNKLGSSAVCALCIGAGIWEHGIGAGLCFATSVWKDCHLSSRCWILADDSMSNYE